LVIIKKPFFHFFPRLSIVRLNFKNDTMLNTNLLDQLPIVKNEMELSLKSFIQQYNQRLIDNDLTIESEVKNID
ncbi:MAG: hypothetical protein ACI9UJ_002399, partial [bacterium]